MRILLYGSSYLAARCCRHLWHDGRHTVVCYVPNASEPTVPGIMPSMIPPAPGWCLPYDLALSIQYDRKITEPHGLNLHTGLLPEWGGCDILHHTLHLGAREQGLTLHVMTEEWDAGPIVAKTTYPVLPGDTVVALYERMLTVAPSFLLGALALVEQIGVERLNECQALPPRLFRRGELADLPDYAETKRVLRERFT